MVASREASWVWMAGEEDESHLALPELGRTLMANWAVVGLLPLWRGLTTTRLAC